MMRHPSGYFIHISNVKKCNDEKKKSGTDMCIVKRSKGFQKKMRSNKFQFEKLKKIS